MRVLKTILLTLLALFSLQAMAANEVTGQNPEAGKSYYLYNVYTKSYVAFDSDGKMSLKAQGTLITIDDASTGNDNSTGVFFMATASGQKVATNFLGEITADGSGKYDHWHFQQVAGTDADQHIYTIGCRIPDAGAMFFLYWDEVLSRVVKLPFTPASTWTKGQWLLVAQEDAAPTVVTLDEASESYEQPSLADGTSATVHLMRKFTVGSWNSLCLPFAVDAAQIASQWGEGTQVAKFTGCTETTLQFTSVTDIEAGQPYLVNPQNAMGTEGYYEFTGVTSFGDTPTDVTQTPVTFRGSYYKTTAPQGAYVLSKNEVYHLQSDMAMKGFRAYFQESETSASKIHLWSLDGDTPTSIDSIVGEAKTLEVYNLNGQRVASKVQTLDRLAKGVYIVNGKKMIVQ